MSKVVLTKESLVFLLSSSPVIFSVSLCFLSMQSFVDGYYFLGNCGKTSGQRIKPQTEESPLRVRVSVSLFFLCGCRFSPGLANDPSPSTGTIKRRTQSLSALPKDGDRKVSPECTQSTSRQDVKNRSGTPDGDCLLNVTTINTRVLCQTLTRGKRTTSAVP